MIRRPINILLEELKRIIDKECYICGKHVEPKNWVATLLPTEKTPIILCSKCMKKFKKQAKVHSKMFSLIDQEVERQLRNDEIKLAEFHRQQFLKTSYAHKLWLDHQRRIYAERGAKNKG